MSAKEITSQRLRHYVRHIHISTDEHNLQRASQTLLAQPMQPAVDVAAVFVGDGVVGDADRRLVIGEHMHGVVIAAMNTEITN